MKVSKSGKTLLLSEADVERTITKWLAFRGWECIKTDAGQVRRGSGRPAHASGTLDYVCIHRGRYQMHTHSVFFAEFKAAQARTAPARKRLQTAEATRLRRDGFLVYHAPDGMKDPLQDFEDWFRENVFGERTIG